MSPIHRAPSWILACCCLSASALAVEPVILVHEDLQREQVQLLGVGDDRLRYFGADRKLTALESSKVVRLELRRQIASTQVGRIRLIDGQILAGRPATATEGGQVIGWETDLLGAVALPLDRVASFTIAGAAELPAAEASDVILLANGDRLTGFVDAVAPAGLALDRDGTLLELPWESIHAASLANPIQRESGTWVVLVDGSELKVTGLAATGEKLLGEALGQPLDVSLASVARIDFAQRHRLAPLGDLPRRIESGGSAFGVEYPPKFEAQVARLHAPIAVRFNLPTGARRFAADARIEPESADRGDLVLIVSDGRKELLHQRLNQDQPHVRVNVELGAGPLIIQLDEGAGGPVRDRLVLENPSVLVETPADQ